MKKFVQWCDWELRNEFMACAYFSMMLFCYVVVEFLYGKEDINIWVIVQMFLLNYVLAVLHRFLLDQEKGYDNAEYYARAGSLVVISLISMIAVCHCFSWFKGYSPMAEWFMYICMVCGYLFVWFIARKRKEYDTKELNQQLEQYKKNQKGKGRFDEQGN